MELTERKHKINSLLLVIYLFGSSLTIPFKELMNSGVPIWILTIVVLCFSFYINKLRVNLKAFILIFTLIFLFIMNLYFVEYKSIILNLFFEFLKFGIIPLYLASFIKDYKALIKYWYYMGIFNLAIWIGFLNLNDNSELGYMSFGVYMTYSFIIFLIYFYNNKLKKINLLLLVITFILIFLFGNRSSAIICLVLVFYFEFKTAKYKSPLSLITFTSIYFSLICLLIIKMETILVFFQNVLLKMGITSYIFQKIEFMLRFGVSRASSGRDDIYTQSINLIKDNYLLPKGVGYFEFITGEVYPHNIFLEMFITFGFLGIGILCFLFYLFFRSYIKSKNYYFKVVLATLFIFTFVRLIFSSTFWTETTFWIIMGIILNWKSHGCYEREIKKPCNRLK
jgi:hypothetical protein